MAFHEMHHQSKVTKTSIKYLHYCWQNHKSYLDTNSLVPTHTKQAFLLYTPFTSGTDFTSRLTLFPSHATLILSTTQSKSYHPLYNNSSTYKHTTSTNSIRDQRRVSWADAFFPNRYYHGIIHSKGSNLFSP